MPILVTDYIIFFILSKNEMKFVSVLDSLPGLAYRGCQILLRRFSCPGTDPADTLMNSLVSAFTEG
jgi:hypothetical protein